MNTGWYLEIQGQGVVPAVPAEPVLIRALDLLLSHGDIYHSLSYSTNVEAGARMGRKKWRAAETVTVITLARKSLFIQQNWCFFGL